MRFKDFLLLEARNPHKESYLSVVDKLRKYKDDSDIYISFTELPKLGINPTTHYATPAGVYTYPIKQIWDQFEKDAVPYAGAQPYIQVLKHTKQGKYIEDISNDYSKKQFEDDMPKLKEIAKKNGLFEDHIIPSWVRELKGKGYPQEKIDAVIKDFSTTDKPPSFDQQFMDFLKKTEQDTNNKSDGGIMFYLVHKLAQKIVYDEKRKITASAVAAIQNGIWRQLGYNFIGDKAGKGIIHPSEPMQAVFLDSKAYKHIDSFKNRRYEKLKEIEGMSKEEQNFATKLVYNQKRNLYDATYDNKNNPLLKNEKVQKYLLNNAYNEISYSNIDSFFKLLPNLQKETIKLFKNNYGMWKNAKYEISTIFEMFAKGDLSVNNLNDIPAYRFTEEDRNTFSYLLIDKYPDAGKLIEIHQQLPNLRARYNSVIIANHIKEQNKIHHKTNIPDWIQKLSFDALHRYKREHKELEKSTEIAIDKEIQIKNEEKSVDKYFNINN